MLSEDLQDRIRSNQSPQSRVPHGSKVFAGGFLQGDIEGFFTLPNRFTIRGQTSSQGIGIHWITRLYSKAQLPHGHHQNEFTLLLEGWVGWPTHAHNSWLPLGQ